MRIINVSFGEKAENIVAIKIFLKNTILLPKKMIQ